MAQWVKNMPAMQETQAWKPTPVFWKIPWTEESSGYSSWDCPVSDMTEQLTLFGG